MALTLRTRHWGGGERRILLLHGISWNTAGWWRLGPDLAERGWDVTAVDLRGHGASPGGDDYRLSSYAEDVLALGRWDVVLGHSLGGALAVLASSVSPRFSKRLILQEPALLLAPIPIDESVRWLLEPYGRPRTVEAIAADNPSWHPEDVRLKIEALGQCSPAVVEATVRDNPDWNLIAETAGLLVPTTIIGGDPEYGGIVPVTIGEWFAAENPFVKYVVLAGSGHSAHREPASYEAYLGIVLGAAEGEA
ncbi:MAG: alpha/beta hydrolase [Acidimicrobiia bacterium]|nr:alpha/beta hydrolase [Acidimicrobiia bacterium]